MNGPLALQMSRSQFAELTAELARRGEGRRESGAFLLASANVERPPEHKRTVVGFAFYDDLDPASLTGGITFGAIGYSALGGVCRAKDLCVVADIHTHPGNWVQQSAIDSRHPMSAIPGHIAIIAPNYSQGSIRLCDLGLHVFRGAKTWESRYQNEVREVLHLTGSYPFLRIAISALRSAFRALRCHIKEGETPDVDARS
jgi:proteasome lid subunit RPN8/RPN11